MSDIEPIAWMSKTGAKTLSRSGFLTVGKREDIDRTVPIYGPEAADEITRLRTLLSEAHQREKDARRVALEESATIADVLQRECEQTAKGLRRLKDYARSKQVEREAYASGVIAANIRALQSEER